MIYTGVTLPARVVPAVIGKTPIVVGVTDPRLFDATIGRTART